MVKISVVVPIYNVEQYLEGCLDSLVNQTLSDIEIVLVDDGSPDNCPAICDEYAKKDSRLKVIHKKNAGVSAARNDGLSVASGEYVIFCDSDDWMELNALEILYCEAVRTDADIVIADVYQVSDNSRKHAVFYAQNFVTEDKQFIDRLIETDICRTYCPLPPSSGPAFGYGGPWNKLVKRSLLIDNEICFDLRVKGIFDDILYTAYILAVAKKISYVSIPVYDYRIIGSSITHVYKPNILEINDAIFNSWQEFFSSQNADKKYERAFYACVLRRMEESINLYFANEKNDKSVGQMRKEFKEILKKEPYSSAIKKVDISKITKKQKLIVWIGRTRMSFLIRSLIK